MTKNKPEAAAENTKAVTDNTATTEPKKPATVVKTDNSNNGYLAARRAARAKAMKGAK